MLLFWFLYIYHHKVVKRSIQYFCKSLIIDQLVLYFSNSLSISIRKNVQLLSLFLFLSPSFFENFTYPLNLGNIKTDVLIISSKYPIKYLELLLVSINFETTALSTPIS